MMITLMSNLNSFATNLNKPGNGTILLQGAVFSLLLLLLIPLSTIPAFGDTTYELLSNRFHNQPLVCIYEPDVPNARDVILDAWVSETELGVKQWQYSLQQSEIIQHGRWNIDVEKIPVDKQPFFDNEYCDVEIRFDATAPDAAYAGIHWMEGNKSQIHIVYTDLEVCSTWTDEQYRYRQWCYKEDYSRSKSIGNVASHEFGHALGLEHYESDDPDLNYEWSLNPSASPSIMTIATHYDETKNTIREIDLDKVKEIYGTGGFGDPKPAVPPMYPAFETKNLGGFDSFSTSATLYFKQPGKINYITIDGKVAESAYLKRQKVEFKVTFPDGHDEVMTAMTLENRQFSLQIRLDRSTPVGEYSLAAKIRGFDSPTLFFSVLDEPATPKSTPEPTKEQTPEPVGGKQTPEPINKQTPEHVGGKQTPESILEPVLETTSDKTIMIPLWIKDSVKQWSDGKLDDQSFAQGIEFLISYGVTDMPANQGTVGFDNDDDNDNGNDDGQIPLWVRTNMNWWADGLISDSDFVMGIKYMVNNGIILIN